MPAAYSDGQVDRYMEYVSLPSRFRRAARPALNLEFLHALHTHQISTIPYDNLSLHYSLDHQISLNPLVLYKKLVSNGRGGYCMENSIFFNHILRALGFQVYPTGVRIRRRIDGIPQGAYMGWSHIVNVVTLADGAKYVVDVSFGGDGPVHPLPLVAGHISQNIGTQELRLMYDNIPEQTDKSRKLWIYQYRNGPLMPWNSFYSFSETEFLHQDFEVMNYFTSTNPASFQTYTVVVVKFLQNNQGVYGKIMLANADVKLNSGGKTHLLQKCQTEDERIQALKQHFGITLTAEERAGIQGRSSELPSGPMAIQR